MKIGIIACEDAPGWGGEQGLCAYITKKFKAIDSNNDNEYFHFHAVSGQLPNQGEMKEFDGFVISGSHYSVNDEHEWIAKLMQFVIALNQLESGPKLFGICFGHQLVAKALGGKVERNPSRKFVWGTGRIAVFDALRNQKIYKQAFGEERHEFKIMQSHGECVTALPKEALCVGQSPTCQYEILVYGDRIMSTQGHPELVTDAMVGNILPRLKQFKILNDEEEKRAVESLTDEDHSRILGLVKQFLGSK
eukprot:Seg2404.6 transcript_id=Seg2404.6/GoldUCD/mRNA.D3Y31 product="Gamma-glutamyl peptidase 3" protein_id=Seg2404.6/GoldUCD/D3Y31